MSGGGLNARSRRQEPAKFRHRLLGKSCRPYVRYGLISRFGDSADRPLCFQREKDRVIFNAIILHLMRLPPGRVSDHMKSSDWWAPAAWVRYIVRATRGWNGQSRSKSFHSNLRRTGSAWPASTARRRFSHRSTIRTSLLSTAWKRAETDLPW